MGYKTVLTIAKTNDEANFTFPVAVEIAAQFASTLIGLCPIPEYRRVFWDGGQTSMEDAESAYEDVAAEIEEVFRLTAFNAGVDAEWRAPRVKELQAVPCILDQAHYADLIVTNAEPGYPTDLAGEHPHEALILGSGRPVLIVPAEGGPIIGKPGLIGWNADRAGSRALFDAVPLLQTASKVDVVQFPEGARATGYPKRTLDDVATVLERHGIGTTLHTPHDAPKHVGETLFAWARELESGFVVMGGYGHSRVREAVLGGVTRFALANRPLPILFGH